MNLTLSTVFPDGSGAPATAEGWGVAMALDFLGEVKVNVLRSSVTPRLRSRAIQAAVRAYEAELRARVASSGTTWEEWAGLNRNLYQVKTIPLHAEG